MNNCTRMLAFVLMPFAWQLAVFAEEPESVSEAQYVVGGSSTCIGWQSHQGILGSMYSHSRFDLPSHYYGVWHRPRAFGSSKAQRCAEEPFRPLGFGNLFHRPCAGHRMDYTPYRLSHTRSNYGPSYHVLRQDPRCDNDGCENCRCR